MVFREHMKRSAEFLNKTHTGSGIKFDPSWVQYSPGAIKRLLAEFVPTLLFEDGTDLFFPTPSYEVIKSAMNRRGATVHDVPLDSLEWPLVC